MSKTALRQTNEIKKIVISLTLEGFFWGGRDYGMKVVNFKLMTGIDGQQEVTGKN